MTNLEAENMFIGSLLKDGTLIQETSVQPKHLYDSENKKVLELIMQLDKNNENIDIVSVVVASKGQVNKERLASFINSIASVHTFKTIERSVIEEYKLREAKRIQSKEITSLEDIASFKEELSELNIASDNHEYDHQQAMIDLYESVENQRKGLSGYDTGFSDLNTYLDGFQEGDLIISAARPSTGKTAKMLAHASEHCKKGHIAVIFSLEMSAQSLNKRMISLLGKIDGSKMRNPKQYFNDNDWNRYTQSLGILSEMSLYIYDQSGQKVSFIREKVAKLRKQYPGKQILVMIDYLQLMRSDGRFENKNIEVGEITRSLKELAKEYSVPVYLLSQLSRGVESRQDKRPMMSDIRDSGSVEQDADVIEFLYRDDYYDDESENAGIIEVIIAKQRNGPVGKVELAYQKEHNGFYGIAHG